jgi:hypothetical protein
LQESIAPAQSEKALNRRKSSSPKQHPHGWPASSAGVSLAQSLAKQYDRLMIEARSNRRLAAILAADVVGYSRMMAE